MGDLHDLTTGPVSPAVATIFAALGCLLSILLITRARQHTGWRRVRLVAYAIPALVLPAIFLPALVTVLALRVDGSVLLLAPVPLGYSLAAATGGTAIALLMVCFGRPGSVRQVLSGMLLVGAIGGTGAFLATSLTTGHPIGVATGPTGVALALACVTGVGLATALAATRSLRRALGTATLLGLSLATIYHVAGAGLTLRPAPGGPVPAGDVTGLSPQRIGLPAVVVIAVVVTFTWYFTLGTATGRDLRRMFDSSADVEEIEPWMVEQVRRRVALTSTAYAPIPGWPDVWARDEPTVAVHAVPIVGRGVASAFAHRARAALPPGSGETPQPAEESAADNVDRGPADDCGRPDVVRNAPVIDSLEWPGAGRNEPSAAWLGARSGNSRFGSGPVGAADERDAFEGVDLDAWAARLRSLTAARTAVAAGRPEAPPIVHDYRAGSPLPRRNARPFHRT